MTQNELYTMINLHEGAFDKATAIITDLINKGEKTV